MLTFLKKHSSIISRLMITQLGMAIFGLSVTLAATAFNTSNNREDPLMILVASGFRFFSICFCWLLPPMKPELETKLESRLAAWKKTHIWG